MRPLRFRAWDKIEKVMCQVEVINFQKGCLLRGNSPTEGHLQADGNLFIHGFESGHFVRWADLELMEYTGLKDKNGKEIYHLDIIKTDCETQFGKVEGESTVVWSDRYLGFGIEGPFVDGWGVRSFTSMFYLSEIEIIGNIYENPELLEEKDERQKR